MRRYLPLAAIAAAVLLALGVVVTSGGDDKPRPASTSAKHVSNKQVVAAKPTGPTPPTQKVSGPHDDPVPILMYHVTKSAPAGTPYPELWVSPADFKGQMNWLADHGYTGITMRQLFDYWNDGYALPKKPIVISFDDGYPSHAKVARPVLATHHWPGVLFLELHNVGSPETGFTHSMIDELIAAGWEIDSHTLTHPDLTTVGAAQLKTELVGSRAKIKKEWGQPADFFCYPAGKYDATVVAATKAAGYEGATTVDDGLGKKDEPYTLKRVRIDGGDGVEGFAAKLRQAEQ
ncbi:MAG: polysaccharide deacetylase family protein [Solirubrobacterales bacterium]